MFKIAGGIVLAFILILIIMAGVCGSAVRNATKIEEERHLTAVRAQSSETTEPSHPEPKEEGPPPILMSDYAKLKMGIRYSAVEAILGPGEESSRTEMAGYTTVMYQWQRSYPNIQIVMLMFQNDRLVNKNQTGLR